MSKVSAMQSLREARYAAARAPRPAATAPVASPPAPRRTPAPPVDGDNSPELFDTSKAAAVAEPLTLPMPSDVEDAAPEEALCGHRSMNNRICRRPAGHPEKNHRYN